MRNRLPKAECPKCGKLCLAAELAAYDQCEDCANDPDVHIAFRSTWCRCDGPLPNREGANVAGGAYKGRTARQLDTHTES
jgi:hypothetical protein